MYFPVECLLRVKAVTLETANVTNCHVIATDILFLSSNHRSVQFLYLAASLPTSAKRTNKGRFYRAKAFIRNNDAADRLTVSWFAIEKQENERNVRDPEVRSGFSIRGRRVVELLKMSWLRLWIMEAVKPVGRLFNCTNEPVSGLGSLLYICYSNSESGETIISGTNKTQRSTRTTRGDQSLM